MQITQGLPRRKYSNEVWSKSFKKATVSFIVDDKSEVKTKKKLNISLAAINILAVNTTLHSQQTMFIEYLIQLHRLGVVLSCTP